MTGADIVREAIFTDAEKDMPGAFAALGKEQT